MKQFAYLIEYGLTPEQMNNLGQRGWELVAVDSTSRRNLYFKKELTNEPKEL